jgi:hypothetical protein
VKRQTADLVALILAAVVAVVVVITALAALYVAVFHPQQNVEGAFDFISRIVSVLVAALVGFMAGRKVNGA